MECEQCKDYVFEYIDKSLDQSKLDSIKEHLHSCKTCKKFYDEEDSLYDESFTDMIEQVDQIALKDDIITKIQTKFHEGDTKKN